MLDVHEADVRDRDGAPPVILEMLEKAPRVEKLFADGGYAGAKLEGVLADPGVSGLMEIVEKPEETKGFTVLRRRRVVERSFAWMGRCRRLAKDVERTLARSVAWAKLAACRFMMQWVARCRNAGNSAWSNTTTPWLPSVTAAAMAARCAFMAAVLARSATSPTALPSAPHAAPNR